MVNSQLLLTVTSAPHFLSSIPSHRQISNPPYLADDFHPLSTLPSLSSAGTELSTSSSSMAPSPTRPTFHRATTPYTKSMSASLSVGDGSDNICLASSMSGTGSSGSSTLVETPETRRSGLKKWMSWRMGSSRSRSSGAEDDDPYRHTREERRSKTFGKADWKSLMQKMGGLPTWKRPTSDIASTRENRRSLKSRISVPMPLVVEIGHGSEAKLDIDRPDGSVPVMNGITASGRKSVPDLILPPIVMESPNDLPVPPPSPTHPRSPRPTFIDLSGLTSPLLRLAEERTSAIDADGVPDPSAVLDGSTRIPTPYAATPTLKHKTGCVYRIKLDTIEASPPDFAAVTIHEALTESHLHNVVSETGINENDARRNGVQVGVDLDEAFGLFSPRRTLPRAPYLKGIPISQPVSPFDLPPMAATEISPLGDMREEAESFAVRPSIVAVMAKSRTEVPLESPFDVSRMLTNRVRRGSVSSTTAIAPSSPNVGVLTPRLASSPRPPASPAFGRDAARYPSPMFNRSPALTNGLHTPRLRRRDSINFNKQTKPSPKPPTLINSPKVLGTPLSPESGTMPPALRHRLSDSTIASMGPMGLLSPTRGIGSSLYEENSRYHLPFQPAAAAAGLGFGVIASTVTAIAEEGESSVVRRVSFAEPVFETRIRRDLKERVRTPGVEYLDAEPKPAMGRECSNPYFAGL